MEQHKCSLCGKIKEDLALQSDESPIKICADCIEKHIEQPLLKKSYSKSLTPKLIYNLLSKYIIGQDRAKKVISIALASHHRRIEDPTIEKSNILIVGPTGSGKTEFARSISKLLGIPLAIGDATTFTAHGYVGEDVESVLYQLLNICDWDVKKAENGMIFIDEIDKIAKSNDDAGGGNIGTTRVQQSLLKMLEGGKIKLSRPANKKTNSNSEEVLYIDTSKILFICAGAFVGVRESKKENIIGLVHHKTHKPHKKETKLSNKQLTDYGIIPELIGRLPVKVETEELSVDLLIKILTKSENSLVKQYKKLMNQYGLELEFSNSFLKHVAEESLSLGTGARGLKTIMEEKLEDLMFEGPSMGANKIAIIKDSGITYKDKEKEEDAPKKKARGSGST